MRDKQIGFAALQEVMWNKDTTVHDKSGYIIVNFQSQEAGYRGMGFFISEKWKERIVTARLVNDRMAVMRLRT